MEVTGTGSAASGAPDGGTDSLFDHVPRVRFTNYLPIDGTIIGPTVWVGSVARGWRGKTFRRGMFWGVTWRVSGVKS